MVAGYIIVCFLVSLGVYLMTIKAWLSMVVLSALLLPMVWPDKKARVPLTAIGGTLLFVQLWLFADMGKATWIAFFATWVALSWHLWRQVGKEYSLTIAFCVFSAMAYLFGRISGAEFSAISTGFPYLLAGNIFAIIAILFAGWRGGVSARNMGHSIWSSGGTGLGSDFGLSSRVAGDYPLSKTEASQEIGAKNG